MNTHGENAAAVKAFTPEEIAAFWEKNPCGSDFVDFRGDFERFFKEYDAYRYRHVEYILPLLDSLNVENKDVLEIGLGQGADAQQLAMRGGRYSGIDLTDESVRRVRMRFKIFNLPYKSIDIMNAEEMTLPDESVDLVYSNGVLLTSPRIEKIVAHIHRVLRKGGRAVIMLYYKNSLNYHLSIRVIRRLGIFLLYIPLVDKLVSRLTGEPLWRLRRHKEILRSEGLRYLRMQNFIHKATDGPDNVYTSVWTKQECDELFKSFSSVQYDVRFLNERHFPILIKCIPQRWRKYLERRWGWNLLITATK
jgi:ubiquinone/menaquinone biosynthesis C-methylase UbiE